MNMLDFPGQAKKSAPELFGEPKKMHLLVTTNEETYRTGS